MFIASAKIPEHEERSRHVDFMGHKKSGNAREAFHHADFMDNCLLLTRVCFIYLGDEFFFLFLVYLNEMSTLGESKVLSFFLVLIMWNEEER